MLSLRCDMTMNGSARGTALVVLVLALPVLLGSALLARAAPPQPGGDRDAGGRFAGASGS